MRTIPAGLQSHLDGRATTMCHCWRITRQDGLVQGFTNHDEDLTFDGTTFKAASGFTATQVEKTLGLQVDNMNVEGALSDDTINEDDLAAGLYDDAYVELFWVNWQDVSERIIEHVGFTGETKRMGLAFSAELRGLATRLSQTTTRTFQRTCDAILGDSRCRKDISGATFTGTGSVSVVQNSRSIQASGLGSYDDDWFTQGVLTWTSGNNVGQRIDVKTHNKSGSNVTIELWYPPAYDIEVGDDFTVTAGCQLTKQHCKNKFDNIVNFQGFPTMPGNDAVIRNVDPAARNEGTSVTKSSKGG